MLADLSREIASVVSRTMPSVVSICAMGADLSESWGSGFLFDDAGHVVTNYHVVEHTSAAMRGRLPESDEQVLNIVGIDPKTDLAILKLDGAPASHLQLRAQAPMLGELCIALGSPLGEYRESVALGMVSGIGRSLPRQGQRPLEHAIQTDAAINHGNSGGPLIDVSGSVIGVNQSGRTDAQGINFAVPAEIVSYVAAEILEFGSIQRAALGVSVAEEIVPLDGRYRCRLVVVHVGEHSAGLFKNRDVILKIAGTPIIDRGDLFLALSREKIGTSVEVELLRDGSTECVTATPAQLA